jgi:hypothetical protein
LSTHIPDYTPMRSFKRLFFLTCISSLSFVNIAFAQDEIDQLLSGGIGDANKLMNAYLEPVVNSVSLSLNQGWYNTAKTHKIAGIDLTITVNAMTIPKSAFLYKPSDLGLQEVELDPDTDGYPQAPTLAGPEVTPIFRLKDDPSQTFDGPPGLDLKETFKTNKIPMPMVHLGFGLPKSTDLKLRFVPTIDLGDGTLKFYGIGVMHDIKQWIPGIKLLPFDLSGFFGYTHFQLESQLDPDNASNADQKGVFTINSTTIQVLISKKISVLTGYAGVGYNIARSNVALKGKYDINGDGDESDAVETNPISLDFAASGPRATAGLRLKLAVFTFHADYTLQKYKCLSVGFGIAVR